MGTRKYLVCVAVVAGCASLLIARNQPAGRMRPPAKAVSPLGNSKSEAPANRAIAAVNGARFIKPLDSRSSGRRATNLSIPLTLEKNMGQAASRVAFVGRGRGMTALLTREGIEIVLPTAAGEKGIGRTAQLRLAAA